MAKSCTWIPKVKKREGTQIKERQSKLFQGINNLTKDRELTKQAWGYSRTSKFQQDIKYMQLDHDEMGEVTLPSFMEAMGMKEDYENSMNAEELKEKYHFNRTFENPHEAMTEINHFNQTEKNHIAIIDESPKGYVIDIVEKAPENIEIARKQSFNHELNRELLDLLESMGFSVAFSDDPRYKGLFSPKNATFKDNLIKIIDIAKGEQGEQALPEEVAHLLIEGLQSHPLVQRLFNSLSLDDIKEILGNDFDNYAEKYDNDSFLLCKEAAGKLLADYIESRGTINQKNAKTSLVGKLWKWVKKFFSNLSRGKIFQMENHAYERVAPIYNMIVNRELLPLINKHDILQGDDLYALKNTKQTLEQMAVSLSTTLVWKREADRNRMLNRKAESGITDTIEKMLAFNKDEEYYKSLMKGLEYVLTSIQDIDERIKEAEKVQRKTGNQDSIINVKHIANVIIEAENLNAGYSDILNVIAACDDENVSKSLGISKESAEILSEAAEECRHLLNAINQTVGNIKGAVVFNAARTVMKEDRVRGIGNKRNELIELSQILDHASQDISFVDRWLTAMGDADYEILSIIDALVKNQKYERDFAMIELNAQIAKADQDLRKAGYTSDFMLELDENGIPNGRIISQYDWDSYRKDLKEAIQRFRDKGLKGQNLVKAIKRWKKGKLLKVDIDKENDYYEYVPNPEIYSRNKDKINNLPEAQKIYYEKMMGLKKQMMSIIPQKGQHLYKAIYISQSDVEGIITGTNGQPLQSMYESWKKKFIRRPDDLGFGTTENMPGDFLSVLEKNKDPDKAADEIINILIDSLDDDVLVTVNKNNIKGLITKHKDDKKKAVNAIMEYITSENFYYVDVDFAGNRVNKLPIYYTRRLRDMNMISRDFSGSMVSYCAMATNYSKMNEVVDLLEVMKSYVQNIRINEVQGDTPVMAKLNAFGQSFKKAVGRSAKESNIGGLLDDYFKSAVYEQRKNDEGTFEFMGNEIDKAKLIDTIKDYTGLVGLGFNIFSNISNVTVGTLQQFIEASAGEYFTWKDYAKALWQYRELVVEHLAELNSPLKKNKLSLLIQMFDPTGEQFESYRESRFYKNPVARILGNGVLAYLGQNAGEHELHCTTMLAMFNNIKLHDKDNPSKTISLYDALEVKEGEDGISRLELKKGYTYEQVQYDNTGTPKRNKNYGRPLRDEKGKIIKKQILLEKSNDIQTFLFKQKGRIHYVNNALNGAFSADDKGAIHRRAVLRLVMQFRQWMPAHYSRRFAAEHYVAALDQRVEGYWRTVGRIMQQATKEIAQGKLNFARMFETLSDHEKANVKRALTEVGMFAFLSAIIRLCGRVKDRDRSWLDKMFLYQLNRMKLELGASFPGLQMFDNMMSILQSPTASLNTFENLRNLLNVSNMFDEVESGPYQGWSEWARDATKVTPAYGQISKAYYMDDGLFTMFEQDD